MLRRCAYFSGVMLIGVALGALPSVPIVESYVGGSAVHGSVEDGRYFVNPVHGRPIVEVSESTWWTVYWIERLCPWSIFVPGLVGLFLTGYGKGPNSKPPPIPPAQLPHWVLRACLVCTGIIVGGSLLCWFATRTPWVVMLVGYVLVCMCVGTIVLLYSRSLRQQSTPELDPANDPAHK